MMEVRGLTKTLRTRHCGRSDDDTDMMIAGVAGAVVVLGRLWFSEEKKNRIRMNTNDYE